MKSLVFFFLLLLFVVQPATGQNGSARSQSSQALHGRLRKLEKQVLALRIPPVPLNEAYETNDPKQKAEIKKIFDANLALQIEISTADREATSLDAFTGEWAASLMMWSNQKIGMMNVGRKPELERSAAQWYKNLQWAKKKAEKTI